MHFLNLKYLRKQNNLFTNTSFNGRIIYTLRGVFLFMNKVYGFTNEFVAAYPEIYDFDNANVLSIIGSGDQYFTAMLAGAKSVTVFDLNVNAWHHFVLKFMAIRYLSYEEFWQFFITDGLDNLKLYLKIRDYLPSNVKDFFDLVKITKLKFSNIKVKSCFMDSFKQKDYLRMLPYLNEENYYKLQELLKKRKLPNFIIKDFSDISLGSERKDYDLLLLSNIYHWMDLSPIDFKFLLDKFEPCVIQALYAWTRYQEIKEFERLGFEVNNVPAVKPTLYNEGFNYVLTYKRTK